MSFIEELQWRGMIQDMTPGVKELLESPPVTAYIGFDPTAPSLTIGNYVQVMILKLFQRAGHKPIVLMGGATGRIGDPSGKDKERELKTTEELDSNLAFQQEQFRKLLEFGDHPSGAVFLNNYDFYKEMNVLEFLRDVGKNLTINYMLSKESVKNRLESGMSYTEFSYQLLQAYDFLYLYRNHQCVLQMGGSDQWGNITAGTEFIRRNVADGKAYALTTPLLTKADGKKFGKSEEGNIWLDSSLTSPYRFYQFWINADDQDLPNFYRYFSLRTQEEIESLENQHAENPNQLKRLLAQELTERIHGSEEYESVLKVSELLFNHKLSPEFLDQLSPEQWNAIQKEIPSVSVVKEAVVSQDVLTFLSDSTGIMTSKSEARRAIKGNAVSINKKKIAQAEYQLQSSDFIQGQFCLVENGKKNKFLIFCN